MSRYLKAHRSLPINAYSDLITSAVSVMKGTVVLTGGPKAGKTLLVPTFVSDALDKEQIYVVYPTRHLALRAHQYYIDAGGSMDIAGTSPKRERIERVAPIRFVSATELLSLDLKGGMGIVFDAAQSDAVCVSIAMAYVRYLREHDDRDLRVVVMSSTLDLQTHKYYWGSDLCIDLDEEDILHPTWNTVIGEPTVDAIVEMIERKIISGSRGVQVFCENAKKAKIVANRLVERRGAFRSKYPWLRYYVWHASTDGNDLQRRPIPTDFLRSPIKILIGSGGNFIYDPIPHTWVDCGISDGLVSHVSTYCGVTYSRTELAPQSLLTAQANRTIGDITATFTLIGETPLYDRPSYGESDLLRSDITQELHALYRAGVDVTKVKLIDESPVLHARVRRALKELTLFGVITKDHTALSEMGQIYRKVDLTPRGLCALAVAQGLNVASYALPLIAMLDMGKKGVRHSYDTPGVYPVTGDAKASEIFQWTVRAVSTLRAISLYEPSESDLKILEMSGILLKSLISYSKILTRAERSSGVEAIMSPYCYHITPGTKKTGLTVDLRNHSLRDRLFAVIGAYFSDMIWPVKHETIHMGTDVPISARTCAVIKGMPMMCGYVTDIKGDGVLTAEHGTGLNDHQLNLLESAHPNRELFTAIRRAWDTTINISQDTVDDMDQV